MSRNVKIIIGIVIAVVIIALLASFLLAKKSVAPTTTQIAPQASAGISATLYNVVTNKLVYIWQMIAKGQVSQVNGSNITISGATASITFRTAASTFFLDQTKGTNNSTPTKFVASDIKPGDFVQVSLQTSRFDTTIPLALSIILLPVNPSPSNTK